MKNTLRHLAIATSILLLYGACSSSTNTSETASQETIPTTDTTTRPRETTQETPTLKIASVSGEVKEIQRGKDGYTAKIVTVDSVVYFATVSHANLKENAHQYRDVKIGQLIHVKGDSWKSGDENHLTVRELK